MTLFEKEIVDETGRSYNVRAGFSFPRIIFSPRELNYFVGNYRSIGFSAPTRAIIEDGDVYNHLDFQVLGFGVWFTLTVSY